MWRIALACAAAFAAAWAAAVVVAALGRPEQIRGALAQARALAQQHRVPVVVEVILEKVTNIAMGTEIDKVNEFEAIDCRHPQGREGLELAGLLE